MISGAKKIVDRLFRIYVVNGRIEKRKHPLSLFHKWTNTFLTVLIKLLYRQLLKILRVLHLAIFESAIFATLIIGIALLLFQVMQTKVFASTANDSEIKSLIRQELYRIIGSLIKNNNTLPASPQILIYPSLEFLDVNSNKIYSNYTTAPGINPLNRITQVVYKQQQPFLNATVWLRSFEQNPKKESVTYGMLIDPGSDTTDGSHRIYYQLEIAWNNQTRMWTKTLKENSPAGPSVLEQETRPYNYSNFFQRIGNNAKVFLTVDTHRLFNSDRYSVMFYSGEKRLSGSWVVGFTKWIYIPSPELNISILLSNVAIRPGEQKDLLILMKTNIDRGNLTLSADVPPFANLSLIPSREPVTPNSYLTSTLSLLTPLNAFPSLYTIQVMANVTVPPLFY